VVAPGLSSDHRPAWRTCSSNPPKRTMRSRAWGHVYTRRGLRRCMNPSSSILLACSAAPPKSYRVSVISAGKRQRESLRASGKCTTRSVAWKSATRMDKLSVANCAESNSCSLQAAKAKWAILIGDSGGKKKSVEAS
jgi:hypothetical protein